MRFGTTLITLSEDFADAVRHNRPTPDAEALQTLLDSHKATIVHAYDDLMRQAADGEGGLLAEGAAILAAEMPLNVFVLEAQSAEKTEQLCRDLRRAPFAAKILELSNF